MNNTYILEFSASWKDIIVILNNEFNYTKNNIGGIEQYFISTDNLKKSKLYNFTIQLNNTLEYEIKQFDELFHSVLIACNYLIKLYKKEKDYNLENILYK